MAACDISILLNCENCKFADEFGRDCKHGLLFPVMLVMANKTDCPNFEKKTLEQLREIEYNKQVRNEGRRREIF